MPRILLSLAYMLLFAGQSATAASAASPGEVEVFAGRFGSSSFEAGIYTQVEEPAVVHIRSTSVPPAHVVGSELVGSELRIYLSVPVETATVSAYEYVLTTNLPPVLLEEGRYQVVVYGFAENAAPPGQRLASLEVLAYWQRARVVAIRPARPTSKDRIEVIFDGVPCPWVEGPRPQILDHSVRLRSDSCWRSSAVGHSLFLEPLSAGQWSLDLEFHEGGIVHRFPFEIVPAQATLAQNFDMVVSWRTASGETGVGKLVQPPSEDSALFYFFSPENWELMVKVLDGCALNGHYWVFAAASTDVAYEVRIDRRNSNQEFRIVNPLGTAAPAVTNVEAFPCDPAAN